MSGGAYYNEIDPYAAQWLRNLIDAGLVAPGDVDERSIVDVEPDDLEGYTQCHFFAGVGGWSLALRLAGWPDDRPVWTGSCPCQPFSQAGKLGRFSDDRHLWPTWVRLIKERRPPDVFGEQVASATEWLRLVRGDLEALDYAVGAMPIEAASAGSFASGDRFWFVATTDSGDWDRRDSALQMGWFGGTTQASDDDQQQRTEWPAQSPVPLLAYGVPARMERCSAFGNAIDPRPAAEFIAAFADLAAPSPSHTHAGGA